MPFSFRSSVAAAAGLLVLQARAEFDDLATLRSRGVGDYQVVGCGDDELLKSFRKVASFREDVPYAEVCGSICHEKYVGTRKGECYCAPEIEESKYKAGSEKCEGETPTIYRDNLSAGNIEGGEQLPNKAPGGGPEGPKGPEGGKPPGGPEGPKGPEGGKPPGGPEGPKGPEGGKPPGGPFGGPGGRQNKNEGENKKEFIQKGGVKTPGAGPRPGGHMDGLKNIIDKVTEDTKKQHHGHGKDKEDDRDRDHDQWGGADDKKHHHGEHKTDEFIQVDDNLRAGGKPPINKGNDFNVEKGSTHNGDNIDKSNKEIIDKSHKDDHTNFGDKSKTGGMVNSQNDINNENQTNINNTNSFNNNNNTYVNINLYNPIICIGDYCAPERKCEHGEHCENYRVVCREDKCRPEVYHGEDRHHLVYCNGDDCRYHQCHEKAGCNEKIVCKEDYCHHETCNGWDCHKKFVCGDFCHHEECKDDECHKKFICKEKECHPEPPCHGIECPRPPPPCPPPPPPPCPDCEKEVIVEKPGSPPPPPCPDCEKEIIVEKPGTPEQPGSPAQPAPGPGPAGQPDPPSTVPPPIVPFVGASEKTFPAVCMFLVSAFAGLVLV